MTSRCHCTPRRATWCAAREIATAICASALLWMPGTVVNASDSAAWQAESSPYWNAPEERPGVQNQRRYAAATAGSRVARNSPAPGRVSLVQAPLREPEVAPAPPELRLRAAPQPPGLMPDDSPRPANGPPPAPATQFRPITGIQPDFDYDPDNKSCEHLCPRDGYCGDPTQGPACPEETPFRPQTSLGRQFDEMHYLWTASNLYHNPLYFQDMQLERYGQVKCNEAVQPFVSLGKFGVQLAGLPYQMALDSPHACRYALGYYRPGDCAPRLRYKVPLNCEAAVTAAAFYTAMAFAIP